MERLVMRSACGIQTTGSARVSASRRAARRNESARISAHDLEEQALLLGDGGALALRCGGVAGGAAGADVGQLAGETSGEIEGEGVVVAHEEQRAAVGRDARGGLVRGRLRDAAQRDALAGVALLQPDVA